jgi:hypothetical protein
VCTQSRAEEERRIGDDALGSAETTLELEDTEDFCGVCCQEEVVRKKVCVCVCVRIITQNDEMSSDSTRREEEMTARQMAASVDQERGC